MPNRTKADKFFEDILKTSKTRPSLRGEHAHSIPLGPIKVRKKDLDEWRATPLVDFDSIPHTGDFRIRGLIEVLVLYPGGRYPDLIGISLVNQKSLVDPGRTKRLIGVAHIEPSPNEITHYRSRLDITLMYTVAEVRRVVGLPVEIGVSRNPEASMPLIKYFSCGDYSWC